MPSELQPAPELGVKREQHERPGGINHERRTGEMPGQVLPVERGRVAPKEVERVGEDLLVAFRMAPRG